MSVVSRIPSMTVGLVPISANPPTWGHVWLINQALNECDHVLVHIGFNRSKAGQYLFKDDESLAFLRTMLGQRNCQRITFTSSSALLADVCIRFQVDTIYRGARDQEEIDKDSMEFRCFAEPFWSGAAGKLKFLTPPENMRDWSSSLVRFMVREHFFFADPGNQPYTTDEVWRLTRLRIHNQIWVHTNKATQNPEWLPQHLPSPGTNTPLTRMIIRLSEIEDRAREEDSPAGDLFRNPNCSVVQRREIIYRMLRKTHRKLGDCKVLIFEGWEPTGLHMSLFDIHIDEGFQMAQAFSKHGDRTDIIPWGNVHNWFQAHLREMR